MSTQFSTRAFPFTRLLFYCSCCCLRVCRINAISFLFSHHSCVPLYSFLVLSFLLLEIEYKFIQVDVHVQVFMCVYLQSVAIVPTNKNIWYQIAHTLPIWYRNNDKIWFVCNANHTNTCRVGQSMKRAQWKLPHWIKLIEDNSWDDRTTISWTQLN